MFDEVPAVRVKKILGSRKLGFSQVRLVPKGATVRPIMNLRRRIAIRKNGKTVFGPAINTHLKPVYNMLQFEKKKQPAMLGSSMFSVDEMYHRLKAFRSKLRQKRIEGQRLFFAKVDVQSCFDTIPQDGIIRLVERLCSENTYRIVGHAEFKHGDSNGRFFQKSSERSTKPSRKFVTPARAGDDLAPFSEIVTRELAAKKRDTVFSETGVQVMKEKDKLLGLLKEHIQQNVVKIGKKLYRQKEGIPQGSVVSSLLCNFFYADFEKSCLDFLQDDGDLLLRMIDDFLIITTDRSKAEQFLHTMHSGNPDYGIKVRPSKSLVNFDCVVKGFTVPRAKNTATFPYCGTMIHTKTLEINPDPERRMETCKILITDDLAEANRRSNDGLCECGEM